MVKSISTALVNLEICFAFSKHVQSVLKLTDIFKKTRVTSLDCINKYLPIFRCLKNFEFVKSFLYFDETLWIALQSFVLFAFVCISAHKIILYNLVILSCPNSKLELYCVGKVICFAFSKNVQSVPKLMVTLKKTEVTSIDCINTYLLSDI